MWIWVFVCGGWDWGLSCWFVLVLLQWYRYCLVIVLVRHVHFGVLHVQLSIHDGMVLSWGVLLFVFAIVSVECPNEYVHDLSKLVSDGFRHYVLQFWASRGINFCIGRTCATKFLCHFYGIVCIWGLCLFGAQKGVFYGYPCVGQMKVLVFV